MKRGFHWLWLLILIPIIVGLTRLHFDAEILNLLPDLPSVRGLKLHQQHFANARELIITVKGASADETEAAARGIAEKLRLQTNLVSSVTWQPPWIESPGDAAELIAYLWANQRPEDVAALAGRLQSANLAQLLRQAREELSTSLSPGEIARLSYDPFGFTRLPESAASSAPSFGEGQELFVSQDGTFRIVFVESSQALSTYQECDEWLSAIRTLAQEATDAIPIPERGDSPPLRAASSSIIQLGFTGRPAFVAEIARGMEKDISRSVASTSGFIILLFWLAHRRVKPLLWLLTLLALTLAGTLALGGFVFGELNVISMGFAAILLGLAVDYGLVQYHEALANPDLALREIRGAIAPSILWAAVTTVTAFLVLNFGGLPGLGQLGTLVAIGVALAAVIMLSAFLPPLFPIKTGIPSGSPNPEDQLPVVASPWTPSRLRTVLTFSSVIILVILATAVLSFGLPRMDSTADPLRPRNSPAYTALAEVRASVAGEKEPYWIIFAGHSVTEVGDLLVQTRSSLNQAVSNGTLASFTLPTSLWPQPAFQKQNLPFLKALAQRRAEFSSAATNNGFASSALGLADAVLDTWRKISELPATEIYWPTNRMSRWIFDRLVARSPGEFYALGIANPVSTSLSTGPSTDSSARAIEDLEKNLPPHGVWLSGWELLGKAIFGRVMRNLPYVLVPMVGLVLVSLWFAFRRVFEVMLSVCVLGLSLLSVLVVMRMAGWTWNLMNLMALPLVLGTGVDYGIFVQLALRRHQGNWPAARRSVGRALLLCGATAIAGFGSLAFAGNAGMSSLGAICAIGITANMSIALLLLPGAWCFLAKRSSRGSEQGAQELPSSLYRAGFWRLGWLVVRVIPRPLCEALAIMGSLFYWACAKHRRDVVVQNLLPALNQDLAAAKRKARALFVQFGLKLVDLWRYETGLSIDHLFGESEGWEHMTAAQSSKRGILLLTPHLGNWEFGAAALQRRGVTLQVITMAEPGADCTELRARSRAQRNIQTIVIGNDPFAFLEVIRRLEGGATVALLMDRPPPQTAVKVKLFSKPFRASIAAAELARASGCTLLPVVLPRENGAYTAMILPALQYDRPSLRDREAREKLTQDMVAAFEPVISRHADQWFHFVPVWSDDNSEEVKP